MVSERLGQRADKVEKRGRADAIPGSKAVAHAAPDGYTFPVADVGPVSVNQFLCMKLAYVRVKDFMPVSPMATANLFLVANAGVPGKDIAERVALAKVEPGSSTTARRAWAVATISRPNRSRARSG